MKHYRFLSGRAKFTVCFVVAVALVITAKSVYASVNSHESHNYEITSFDKATGEVCLRCAECGDEQTQLFSEELNSRGASLLLDVVNDGVVNAKDYAFIERHYTLYPEHFCAYSLNSLYYRGTQNTTAFGYGTRLKTPKTPITTVYANVYSAEDTALECKLVSTDLNTVYETANDYIKKEDTQATFEFRDNNITENEFYLVIESNKKCLYSGMTTEEKPNKQNKLINTANAKVNGKGNIYCEDGVSWAYRKNVRTDQMGQYSMSFYLFTRNDESRINMHTLYVSPDGSDETGNGTQENPYATLFYANSTITSSDYFNRYTIKVADGVYDDLSVAEDSEDNQYILCKNYVYYEGNTEHPENCVLSFDGATRFGGDVTDSKVSKMSVFFIEASPMGGVNTKVSGFHMLGSNLRYVIHIDTRGYSIGNSWEFSDCIVTFLGTPNVTDRTGKRAALGCGIAQNEKGTFKNVVFNCNQRLYNGSEYHYAFYAHNNDENLPAKPRDYECGRYVFDNVDFNGATAILSPIAQLPIDVYYRNCSNIGVITNTKNSTDSKLYFTCHYE